MERRIDVFNHFMPKRYFEKFLEVVRDKGMAKRMSSIALLHDLEGRMRMMDQWPGYQQILTASPPAIELLAGPDQSPELARIANDELCAISHRYPEKFPAFAAASPTTTSKRLWPRSTAPSRSLTRAAFKCSRTSMAARSTTRSTRQFLSAWPTNTSCRSCFTQHGHRRRLIT
jgi:hypothetical protein